MNKDDAILPTDRESISGRYAGVVRFFVAGNRQKATGLRLVALTQLGGLRHQLSLGGDLTGSRTVELPDGSIIETIWNGTMNIIRIVSPGGEEEEVELPVYPYLSGLQEIADVFATPEGEFKLASQFWPAWHVPGGRAQQWYHYNTGYPLFEWPETETDPEIIETDPDVRFIHEWVKTTLPTIDATATGLASFPSWPGMYTGTLRLVVQKLLGFGVKPPWSLNSGLWTPNIEGTDDTKTRWIIEISTTTGVTAYPVEFLSELEADGVDSTTIPDEERYRYDFAATESLEIPTVISSVPSDVFGNEDGVRCRFRLLPAESITNISDGTGTLTPWYSNWAFSYSGREAQIVLIGTKAFGGHDFFYARRYKLTFNQGLYLDANGNDVLYPASATLEEVEGDYLYTTELDKQLFAPVIHPWQEEVFFETSNVPPEPRDAPVCVFYTRDDEEVVLRRYDTALVGTIEDEIIGVDCVTKGCVIPCVYCDQPYGGGAPICNDPACQRYNTTAEDCRQGMNEHREGLKGSAAYYCNRTYTHQQNFTGNVYGIYRWMDWTETPLEESTAVCNLLADDLVRITEYLVSASYQLITDNHYEARTNTGTIVLPLYDREGFFHLQSSRTHYTGSFNHHNYIDPNVKRVNKIIGPYENMPEVLATAPYASTGTLFFINTENKQPDDLLTQQYCYIGSVATNAYGANDSVITLDNPPDGTDFVSGMQAVAAVEMFSGRVVLAPHPPIIPDGEGGDKANLWVSARNADADGGDTLDTIAYPVPDGYRSRHLVYPQYLCFIGDGNTVAKQGDVDMNAIGYLGTPNV